jgi:type IV secretory pathway VirB3-like protein
MVEGWVVPENRALARRPQVLGLPLDYAALLIMSVLFLALTAHHVGAAVYLLGVGWGLGKLVTFYDAFAWELLARSLRIPRMMRP